MKAALLDLNILTALLWPAHDHHEIAQDWFGARRNARWATCALTQLGFVRLVSNPSFSRDALKPAEAVLLLSANLAHPSHVFWVENLSVPAAVKDIPRELRGHQQVTDAYLLALARSHDGVLATFDRGIEALASGWGKSAIELISTRVN